MTLPERWTGEDGFVGEDLHDEGGLAESRDRHLGEQSGFWREPYDADCGQCIDHHPYD